MSASVTSSSGSSRTVDVPLSHALAYALLAAIPLVNVLAPAVWVIPPMTIGLMLAIWYAYRGLLAFDGTYFGLLILCVVSFLPWAFSAEYVSLKTALHAAGLVASITIYYATTRVALIQLLRSGGALNIIRVVYASLVAVSVFILIEFVGSNTGAWNVSDLVPYIDIVEYEAAVFGVVLRPRGFASEPGVMALFYDFALFFVIPLLSKRRSYRALYLAIVLPAYALLFSTASLVCVAIAAAILQIWRLRRYFYSVGRMFLAVLAIAGAIALYAGEQAAEVIDTLIVTRVDSLLSGSGVDYSASDRRQRIEQVADVASAYPLGIGFGIAPGLESTGVGYRGYQLAEGQISLFATFLLAGGIPALLLLTGIVVFTIFRAWNISEFGPYIAAGGLAVTLHHLFVTEFWLPFFWLFLACTNSYRLLAAQTSAYARTY